MSDLPAPLLQPQLNHDTYSRFDTPNAPANIDESPQISPREHLQNVQQRLCVLLNDLGTLRHDLDAALDACALNSQGKWHCGYRVDASRNLLIELYGAVTLLRDGHEQTVYDFGHPVSSKPF